MRILRTALVLGTILPFITTAFACDKDKTSASQQQPTAKTASQSPSTNKSKSAHPGG
jgi:hypothetical protein